MSPLIDCVFQLLIFFMLSSSFLTPAAKLVLPKGTPIDAPEQQEIMVTVDQEGTFYVNTQVVPPSELQSTLRDLVSQSKTKAVTIRGDERMRYEYFVQALDAARLSGATHINVAHRAEP